MGKLIRFKPKAGLSQHHRESAMHDLVESYQLPLNRVAALCLGLTLLFLVFLCFTLGVVGTAAIFEALK